MVTQIVQMHHGSRLYGTHTETSDHDFKGVHIPSANALLLCRPENVITRNSSSSGTKNSPDDVDYQSYSISKFLEMVRVGDTNATEMLFAPPSAIITNTRFWGAVVANRHHLVSRECRGFVRYAQQQATKYCVKGDRLEVAHAVVSTLQKAVQTSAPHAKLNTILKQLEDFVALRPYSSLVELPCVNNESGFLLHFECLDRKIPITAKISDAFKLFEGVRDGYGARARAAMTSNGIDWKAVSHAYRITLEATELLSTGHLTLPIPNAAYVKLIKAGQVDYDKVQDELESKISALEALSANSPLPEKANQDVIDSLVKEFHLTAIDTISR